MQIKVDFSEVNSCISTKFIQTACSFDTGFGEVFLIKTDEVYEGDYNVTPRVYQQVLETKDKLMLDDVTVEIIPLSRVINLSNGYTVTIG